MAKDIELRRSGIKVRGHRGTWYCVDTAVYNDQPLYLLESEVWGDEAACIIVDRNGALVMADVWNGWEDYDYYLDSENAQQAGQ